ncbi:hypothetical protein [Sphingomonas sp. M1A8_2b]
MPVDAGIEGGLSDRMKLRIRIAILAVIAAPTPAFAQSQTQQDRIDEVSRFVVTAPICGSLGMTVDPALPNKVEGAFKLETSKWSAAPAAIERLKLASIQRQSNVLKVDLETASANAKTDAQLRQVGSILRGYGRTCLDATRDPIFSQVIIAPSGFDLGRAMTDMADSMLEAGGLASWQTPAIQSRGDMMMVAGACRKRIGKARSDALIAEFGKSESPRTREYFLKAFDDALNDPELDFDIAKCNRLIMRYSAAIAKAGAL